MKISLIAAMSENRVIGRDNKLPWHLAEDWKNFHKVTKGAPFIMGRKSYESEDMLYSDVLNIVMTRQEDYKVREKFMVAKDFDQALQLLQPAEEIFVLGGAGIFELALPKASRLYLTIIPKKIEGDTYFPEVNWSNWEMTASRWVNKDESNDYGFYINEYKKTINS